MVLLQFTAILLPTLSQKIQRKSDQQERKVNVYVRFDTKVTPLWFIGFAVKTKGNKNLEWGFSLHSLIQLFVK